jgi:hypothetical protein
MTYNQAAYTVMRFRRYWKNARKVRDYNSIFAFVRENNYWYDKAENRVYFDIVDHDTGNVEYTPMLRLKYPNLGIEDIRYNKLLSVAWEDIIRICKATGLLRRFRCDKIGIIVNSIYLDEKIPVASWI